MTTCRVSIDVFLVIRCSSRNRARFSLPGVDRARQKGLVRRRGRVTFLSDIVGRC